jgi:O-antigen/teichoic acid export membrane protein
VSEVPGDGRRTRVARGAIINSAFFLAIGTLNIIRGFVVAGFLTTQAFGIWSIVALLAILVVAVKGAIVSDKYIQQDAEDQETAFHHAFTLELLSAGLMVGAILVLAPLFTLMYGEPELLLPGFAVALILPGLAFQFPISVWYRRMDFGRQRLLMSIDPVVGFIVTIACAAAGLSYWSLIVGVTVGAWVGGIAAVLSCPYRLRLHFDRGVLRQYIAFSGPLVVAVAAGLLIANFSIFFGELALGLAGAGAIGLAAGYSAYTDRVDAILTQALYPAICRVADRRDLLLEVFVKSNRLTLMWGVPFGIALTLFASDLIEFGIGDRWQDALILFQVFGIAAAFNHIGFNWGAFFRAIGDTKPISKVTVVVFVSFCAIVIPALFLWGLTGFAVGIAATSAVGIAGRFFYLKRLFPALRISAHILRAFVPTVPAVIAVLATRTFQSADRDLPQALAELGLYCAVTIIVTLAAERPLLAEAMSYVRRRDRAHAQPVG